MNLHLVFPKSILTPMSDAMRGLGYTVQGTDESVQMFSYWASASDNQQHNVDTAVICEPLNSHADESAAIEEYIQTLYEIRRYQPSMRLVLILPEAFERNHTLVLKCTQMQIYDIYFTTDFSPNNISEWLSTPKTFQDWNYLIINHSFADDLPVQKEATARQPTGAPVQKTEAAQTQQKTVPQKADEPEPVPQQTAQQPEQAKKPRFSPNSKAAVSSEDEEVTKTPPAKKQGSFPLKGKIPLLGAKPAKQKQEKQAPVPTVTTEVEEAEALPTSKEPVSTFTSQTVMKKASSSVQQPTEPQQEPQATVRQMETAPIEQPASAQTETQAAPSPHRLFDAIRGGKSNADTEEEVESLRLNPDRIKKPSVPLPPKQEQDRIVEPRMIAFVSVSRGAGSTFHTVNFARWLAARGFSAAVYENPVEFEGRNYAADFVGLDLTDKETGHSLPHMIQRRSMYDYTAFPQKNDVQFYVVDNGKEKIERFEYSDVVKYAHVGKQTFKLFDFGYMPNRIASQMEFEEVLKLFDHVVCVVDPMPHSIMANADTISDFIRRRADMNYHAAKAGDDKYRFLINRYDAAIPKKELKVIQMTDAVRFPTVDPRFIYEALYSGKIPMDHDKVEEALSTHYMSLADDLDLGIREERKGRKFGLFGK